MFLSNVFYDPSSPWYYVIGVVFLVLIFGALAVYIKFSKRKEKSKSESENAPQSVDADKERDLNSASTEDVVPSDKPDESLSDK